MKKTNFFEKPNLSHDRFVLSTSIISLNKNKIIQKNKMNLISKERKKCKKIVCLWSRSQVLRQISDKRRRSKRLNACYFITKTHLSMFVESDVSKRAEDNKKNLLSNHRAIVDVFIDRLNKSDKTHLTMNKYLPKLFFNYKTNYT
ncbi:hypothetical protein BpHYR1_006383 [Brachionus plicatilis]|uniref:Uncharacterized protein n=1 Tax=Brachionus plicatilis TaxID=10195 RepID=A0A3M7R699_BRAPC|nr:hypothetical protein BpHYR1_006383 [Brachionus plicatilis]